MKCALLALVLLGGFTAALALPRQRGAVELRREAVGGSVHCVFGRGGNLGVSAGPDGLLLVDSQFAELAERHLEALRELSPGAPVYLVNTHWHGDHVGGNAVLGAEAAIVAHANVRRRMAGDPALGDRVATGTPPGALPAVTFEEGLSLHFNGEEVRVIHVPASHTDGDSVVWFTGSKVLHTGDLFFQQGYPFIDVEAGGDVRGMLASVRRVLDLVPADTRIVPGHGRVVGVEDLAEYGAMLEEVVERVEEARAAGRSAEEMAAAGLLEDLDERWGGAFVDAERMLAQVVACLDR